NSLATKPSANYSLNITLLRPLSSSLSHSSVNFQRRFSAPAKDALNAHVQSMQTADKTATGPKRIRTSKSTVGGPAVVATAAAVLPMRTAPKRKTKKDADTLHPRHWQFPFPIQASRNPATHFMVYRLLNVHFKYGSGGALTLDDFVTKSWRILSLVLSQRFRFCKAAAKQRGVSHFFCPLSVAPTFSTSSFGVSQMIDEGPVAGDAGRPFAPLPGDPRRSVDGLLSLRATSPTSPLRCALVPHTAHNAGREIRQGRPAAASPSTPLPYEVPRCSLGARSRRTQAVYGQQPERRTPQIPAALPVSRGAAGNLYGSLACAERGDPGLRHA
ncbi:MAG: hypothetical protein BJ554DRAFT_370, partial [Olpidium bornovanus]